jgi:hypothetical protein
MRKNRSILPPAIPLSSLPIVRKFDGYNLYIFAKSQLFPDECDTSTDIICAVESGGKMFPLEVTKV